MIIYKTEEEIELIRSSNLLVSKTLGVIAQFIKPGVTTISLDKKAEEYIRDNKAVPGFLGYNGYPNTLCTSVNDQIVHGIPSSYELKEGDILSVDCGVILNEYYGDTEVLGLIVNTKESLYKGIEQAVVGKRLGDIGNSIQNHAERKGYSVVRELVGHGLGRRLHEEPEVPNYGRYGTGIKLREGIVICIEPMINLGTKQITQEADGWTIKTSDGKPSAHYELAIAIKKEKVEWIYNY